MKRKISIVFQQAANYAAWQGQQQPQPERPPKQEEPQEDAPAVLMDYVQKQHEELLAKVKMLLEFKRPYPHVFSKNVERHQKRKYF